MKLTALAPVMAGRASYRTSPTPSMPNCLLTSNPVQVTAAPISLLLVTSISTNTNPVTNNNPAFEHFRLGPPGP